MMHLDESGPVPRAAHHRIHVVLALARVAALLAIGSVLMRDRDRETGGEPAAIAAVAYAADGSVLIPAEPVDGVLAITIPPGTAEKMAQGGDGYVLPPVIDLERGDRIVIHNQDSFPHLMLYAFVLPGESDERTFTAIGSETYSAGCTIDPHAQWLDGALRP